MDNSQIKIVVSAAGGAAAAFVEPVLPVAGLCTVMVMAEVVSEMRLKRRLRRPDLAGGRVVPFSRRLGSAVRTLAGVYAALCLAHGADLTLGTALSLFTGGNSALNMTGMLIFIWQLMTLLENEAAGSDSEWARRLRKFLDDKLPM